MSEPSVERHIRVAKRHLVKAGEQLRKAIDMYLAELRMAPFKEFVNGSDTPAAAGCGAGRRHRRTA